jgi:hypothetical protein
LTVQGSFVLNDKLQMPLGGVRDIPIGMPIHKRPGLWPLGQRVANRTTDFVCFAAKQVEEIEITFAEGLPLPRKLDGSMIANKHFSYRSNSEIEGRTLSIRRELTSNVATQVCSRDTEAEISEPLQRVARGLAIRMIFSERPPAATGL